MTKIVETNAYVSQLHPFSSSQDKDSPKQGRDGVIKGVVTLAQVDETLKENSLDALKTKPRKFSWDFHPKSRIGRNKRGKRKPHGPKAQQTKDGDEPKASEPESSETSTSH